MFAFMKHIDGTGTHAHSSGMKAPLTFAVKIGVTYPPAVPAPLPEAVRTSNDFTAEYQRAGTWIISYCPEVPDAIGQGRTRDEARESLAEAIARVIEGHEGLLRTVPGEGPHDRSP